MKSKVLEQGGYSLYILPDDRTGRDAALKLSKAHGYPFYPQTRQVGAKIVSECCSGYLYKTETLRENAVCTVSNSLYKTLELPTCELEIPKDDLVPVERKKKKVFNRITDSRVVFIGGRGLGSRANYEKLRKVAEKFGAHVGCSRPVAMNGWESYDNFVGISGNVLEADVVVTFGVSGAGPFLKGIENCRTVIAVNQDKNALIFKNADYGIVDDCMNVISYLEKIQK